MTEVPRVRVLCVGADEAHLRARCDVLAHNGYQAEAATSFQACHRMCEETFDLVVVSEEVLIKYRELHAALSKAALSKGLKTLLITGFICPEKMIAAVKGRLNNEASGVVAGEG